MKVLFLFGSRQTECMRNIMKDLDHYAAAIRSYLKAPLRSSEREEKLLSPTVEMIQDLRKVRVLICAWERVREEWGFKRERKSWEITLWCHLIKSSLVCTVLLPVRGRGLLLTGTGFGFHSGVSSSGREGVTHFKKHETGLWSFCGFFQDSVANLWGSNSFNNRQKMCKMMRGFYTRTITINRALGYIASGEHRK